MSRTHGKRFGITDALALILATALAMAATRHWWEDYLDYFRPGGDAYRDNFINFMHMLRYFLYSVSYFPATWSVACFMLALRKPRPTFRHALRQPGLSACFAAMVVLILQLPNLAVAIVANLIWFPDSTVDRVTEVLRFLDQHSDLPMFPSMIGCGIAATWAVQATCGRWRPQPNWIDRMGRSLGFFWMATTPFSWFGF
jgi:hypothetical protein